MMSLISFNRKDLEQFNMAECRLAKEGPFYR